MRESQRGKLTGCLHAFTVCSPSKDSGGGPRTPQLMIKHQGQHNVADGANARGGADGGRGYLRIWRRFSFYVISTGTVGGSYISLSGTKGSRKCQRRGGGAFMGKRVFTKAGMACGMSNIQTIKNCPPVVAGCHPARLLRSCALQLASRQVGEFDGCFYLQVDVYLFIYFPLKKQTFTTLLNDLCRLAPVRRVGQNFR